MSDIEDTDDFIQGDAAGEVIETEDGAPEPLDEDASDVEIDGMHTTNGHDHEDENGGMIELHDDSVQGFFGHKSMLSKPVYAVAIHPSNPDIVLSGGEDDFGYLWNASNGERVHTLSGHTDSVVAVGFNFDGTLCATGGMDGKLFVWRVDDGQLVAVLEGPDEVVWLDWHPRGNALLVGSHDGQGWLYMLPTGDVLITLSGAHVQSLLCGTFTPDGKRILTGSEEGSFAVWDPKTGAAIFKWTSQDGRWLQDAVTSIGVHSNSTVAIVGGSDGGARIVNITNGHVRSPFFPSQIVTSLALHSSSIESITISPLLPFAALASSDGSIILLDFNTTSVRQTLVHDDAVVKTQWTSDGLHLLSCSTDQTIRVWDARTGGLVKMWRGHLDAVLCMAMTKQGEMVVTGGDDGVCLVFRADT